MSDRANIELPLTSRLRERRGMASGPDLTPCDLEPIHLSGAIQPHGVLLAAGEQDLIVRTASANAGEHLGADWAVLLGMPLRSVLGSLNLERLERVLGDPRASGTDPMVCHLANGAYELTWFRAMGMVVVELEPVDGATLATELIADVGHAMDALQYSSGVQELCDTAAAEIRHLTGYDRVMVYRFHPDWHGEVIAEQRDATLAPFLGLHYPASDIPRQARRLYLLNQLRMIVDVGYTPVPLRGDPRTPSESLDLSAAGLRSVSPLHLAYLANMGVRSTLTISLLHGTQLWGMLACHHQAPKHIDAQLRAACRLLGTLISSQIVGQENVERQQHANHLAEVGAEVIARMSRTASLADALVGDDPSPLSLTGADGVVARLGGEMVVDGVVPPPEVVELLLERLRAEDEPAELVCDDLPERIPELAPFAEHASGVLAQPLLAAYEDYVLWFRGELVREVSWAGDPDKAIVEDPAWPSTLAGAALGPRRSFDAWVQELHGRSRPWLPAEIEAARDLAAATRELLFSRARDHFAYLAMHDELTGLPNRALVVDRATQALGRQRAGGGRVALLFVDLDRFKSVNDSFGHAAGDWLLREAAVRLKAAIRDTDTVARIGGDEFVVLLEGVEPAEVAVLADRIVEGFRVPFAVEGGEAQVTASVGSALAQSDSTLTELLDQADAAMYRAKESGRNAAEPPTG